MILRDTLFSTTSFRASATGFALAAALLAGEAGAQPAQPPQPTPAPDAAGLVQRTPTITSVEPVSVPGQSRVIKLTGGTTPQYLTLPLNKAIVVELDRDARDVFVANPQYVDAVVRTPRRVFLMSLKLGQTNAIFLDAQGRQIGALEIIVTSDVTDLNSQLTQRIPGTDVKAQALYDNVVLSGTVNSVAEASKAQELALSYTGDEKKVVNTIAIGERQQVLIQVRVSEMSRVVAKQFGVNMNTALNAAGIPVIAGTANQFSLVGRALSDLSGGQIGSVCPGAFVPKSTIDTTRTLNTANSTTQTLTNSDVFTNNLRPDPLTLFEPGLQPGPAFGTRATGDTVQTIVSGVPSVAQTITSSSCSSSNNLQGVVQALERIGLVRTLAEPNLTAVSGEVARFLAGGEFPIPVGRDRDGNITVEYKPFGVGLAFTPLVLSKGRISLQISSEVSELTNTGAFNLAGASNLGTGSGVGGLQGLTLPALSVRRTQTTVELPSGGSLAIGGLIQQNTKQNIDAFPGVKDLPVLGALFRSRDFQNNETELVVTVTAYLVNPVAPTQLARPDDGFVVPTDAETLLLGRLNSVYGKGAKATPTSAPKNAIGYIVQ